MAFKVWSTQEKLLSVDLNANFTLAADLSSTQTFTGAKTFTANAVFGVNGTGVDVQMFGDASGAFSLWDQSANKQIIQGATAAGAGTLLLSTGELTNVDGGILGRIDFAAPLDSAGTDAILTGASIWAEADDTFSSSLNDTDLVFAVAESEAALERMRLSYDGTNVGLLFSGATTIGAGGAIITVSDPIEHSSTLKVGGGYGSTGVTVSAAGVIQANGAITSDGAVTGATLAGTVSTATQNSITTATSLASVGTITSGTWSGVIDGSCTMTVGSDATGDVYFRDASGFLERLAASNDGYVLTSTGAGSIPAWEALPGGGTAFSSDVTVANGYGLVVGGTAQQTISDGGGATDVVPEVQILGTATADMTALIGGWSETATRLAAPTLALLKSGNAAIASHTVVTDDEILGSIIAYGDDGTDYESPAAAIEFAVDGTPGTGDMPGRIVHYTSTDGGEALTERMRIGSDGIQTMNYGGAADNSISGPGVIWNLESGGDYQFFGFNSEGVAHGMATNHDTERIWSMSAQSTTSGTVTLYGLVETGTPNGLSLWGISKDGGQTTKSTSGIGVCQMTSSTNNSTNAANTNLFNLRSHGTTRFIWDSDGDSHQDVGTAWTNFDVVNDAQLCRSVAHVMTGLATDPKPEVGPGKLIRSRFDEWGNDHQEDLIAMGLIPRLSPEEVANGDRPLMNMTQLARVHNGAIWQLHTGLETVKEDLAAELTEARDRIATLETQITGLLN